MVLTARFVILVVAVSLNRLASHWLCLSVLRRWTIKRISISLAQVCRCWCSTEMSISLIKNSPTARCLFSSMYWSSKARIPWLFSVPKTKELIDLKKQFPSPAICFDVEKVQKVQKVQNQ